MYYDVLFSRRNLSNYKSLIHLVLRFNIHIKTKSRGGAAQHAYPDNDYFQRQGAKASQGFSGPRLCWMFQADVHSIGDRSLDELKNVGISVADLSRVHRAVSDV